MIKSFHSKFLAQLVCHQISTMHKKLLFFFLVLALAVIVSSTMFIYQRIKKPSQTLEITTPVQSSETGVEPLATLTPDLEEANLRSDLRAMLPVVTTDFRLTFDYKHNTFIVTLTKPTTDPQATLLSWLTDNQFESIPMTNFVFVQIDSTLTTSTP